MTERDILTSRLDELQLEKLDRINNAALKSFLAGYLELCDPESVFVCDDSPEDIAYLRAASVRAGEEAPLAIPGHTVHFDNPGDQGRDKKNTGILVPEGTDLGAGIETKPREEALRDILAVLGNIMEGREAYVLFFTLGPLGSRFAIPCVQLTDSSYVAHSETLLYRPGYAEFARRGEEARFFTFVHSQGELDARNTCRNLDRRRIFIDLADEIVFSANTQYGGNTIGLKKLAMRLAISRGAKEGWLTEHMLLMGVHGPGGRVTFFMGAFPSLCGKTSTAMLEGETIVGDDIAYVRRDGGEARAVNVEKGMFGIIQGVNAKDDPSQWKALHSPGEVIFSNILVTPGGGASWIGKDGPVPEKGVNFAGDWTPAKRDAAGKEIPPSHPNARFTLALESLDNVDPALHDPRGVPVGAIVYGGRDSDTCVPVEESFDWEHGIVTKGAALESETTAATLGKEGIREFNPMSNLDFLSIPIGDYVRINLEFGRALRNPPRVFSVNYFLRGGDGKFLNKKTDKRVWYKWMELRVHGEAGAIRTPTGFIPEYGDLKRLFQEVLGEEYQEEDYAVQFAVRVPENLAKLERITRIYRDTVKDTPPALFEVLEAQRARLEEARARLGDSIAPEKLRVES